MKKINFLLIILLSALTHESFSQAGDLDSTFGTNGIVTTAIDSFQDRVRSVALQPDGKIVAAGHSLNITNDFALVRYNANGSLDNSFGGTGIATTAIGQGNDAAFSVTIQADGKIVAAGFTGPDYDFALVRYNSNGALDSSFSTDGKAITDIDSEDNRAYSVAIQPDGKIIAAGESFNGLNYDFALVRYNSDGTLDNSFNSTGKVITDFGLDDDVAQSVVIQSDGKIVAAGFATNGGNGNQVFAVVRYKTDGTLDSLFGVAGKVMSPVGIQYNMANSVTLQPDGKIIAAGYSASDDWTFRSFALVRYNSNGSLDNSFSSDGKLTTVIDTGDNNAYSVALQPDGKIVAAGRSNEDFALVRYNSDGTIDSNFGTDGKITTAISSFDDLVFSMAIQPDGKIVAAGSTDIDGRIEFALARYLPGLILGILNFSSSQSSPLIYPNPIQQNETLEYTLTKNESLTIALFDVNGKLIRNFISNEQRTAGEHKETLNIREVPSGNYFLTLSNGDQKMTVKMVRQ